MNYILIQNWIELKPQDKLLYIRWIWLLYGHEDRPLTIASLAQTLRLNKSTVRDSVGRLLSGGKIVQSEERGLFRVAIGPLEDSPIKLSDGKKSFIKKVLGDEEDLSKVRAEELSLRLLKAVLVFLCDDLGVINDFRFSYLSKITGMSIQRLRRYRDELKQAGFILKFVPGGNSPNLYKKALSICIIDPELFGGGKVGLLGFKEQSLLGITPDSTILRRKLLKSSLSDEFDDYLRDTGLENLINSGVADEKHSLLVEVGNAKFFDINEINNHRLGGRLFHFFDELVSQEVRNKLKPNYTLLSRDIISKTDKDKLNQKITLRWKHDVEIVSNFISKIVRRHIENAYLSSPLDVYFFRTVNSYYVLSNICQIHVGVIEKQETDKLLFKSDSVCWEL
jgi:Mn-dependent DtxR family transcriptional regulator